MGVDYRRRGRLEVVRDGAPEFAGIADGIHDAFRSDTFRLDVSDAMPWQVGDEAFWEGMVRLFREGTPDSLEELSLDVMKERGLRSP